MEADRSFWGSYVFDDRVLSFGACSRAGAFTGELSEFNAVTAVTIILVAGCLVDVGGRPRTHYLCERGDRLHRCARLEPRSGTDLLTVVGNLLGAQPGESLRLEGRWKSHAQYGRQFEVQHFTTILPATVQGIRRYLGSGLIKGIGPKMAERIVAHFELDTLRVIEEEPERLIDVPGLGPKRSERITRAWEEQKAIKEVMVFLQGVGVSTSLAVKIYKTYRDSAITVVKNQPYRLASDVWGIGFKTADKIARSLGIPEDSPERVKAGLQFTLSEATEEGHCFLPQETLIAQAASVLGVDALLVDRCLDELVQEEGVVRERLSERCSPRPNQPPSVTSETPDPLPASAVYLVPFHRAEVSLANGLRRLLETPQERLPSFHSVDWAAALGWLSTKTGSLLAPEQEQAVRLALTQRVAVLTGGPGCGKSFTVRSIVLLARAKQAKVVLAAPTGRAAKRLEELAAMRRAPSIACCNSVPVETLSMIATIRSMLISLSSTRPACSMCFWPTPS